MYVLLRRKEGKFKFLHTLFKGKYLLSNFCKYENPLDIKGKHFYNHRKINTRQIHIFLNFSKAI